MILPNFHTHTTFCDGNNTPRELIEKAISLNLSALGFSSHACSLKGCVYAMKDVENYKKTIKELKEEYKDKIEIYLGIEEDVHSLFNREDYDYIIGSCHNVEKDGTFYQLDNSADMFNRIIEVFNGDKMLVAHQYFDSLLDYIENRKPDIIGHFDLLTKFDEVQKSTFLYDKEYTALAEKSIKKASKSGCIFEVNTGAIARGYRTSFYPAMNLLEILKQENAKLILSSDCHNKDFLCANFDKTIAILKSVGFKKLSTIKEGKFIEYDI